ncbi:autotransporter domain-containing protein [Endozoicomonas acroporae]|uniref:autotransporter outer membrane beta-barrel domain-containing protein n=1 Tax=Endozoicomonas acroporae TaxID=1701104 RepID=UPI000C773A38|nr:autotransporter outer membrane beta-barrel domain-containing protein [Endozoicomonas acroporae]
MSRTVIMLRKKALVLGISSVLAGWAASDGLCAEEANPPSTPVAPGKALTPDAPGNTPASDGSGQPPVSDPLDKWPPKNKMTIKDDKTETAITGIEIKELAKNISLEGGELEIPTDVTIKVTGTADGASIVGQSGANTLTLTNTKQASVEVGAGATGVKVVGQSLTISGAGSITATTDATNTTGVSVAGGTLTINGSTIEGSKAAIKVPAAATGNITLNFQGNSAITGLGESPVPALDASSGTGPVTVNIEGGTFTGDIIGSYKNKKDKITISATMGDGIKGSISNFETINIDGTGWTVQGWAEGLSTLTTSSAINNLYVNSQPPTPPQVPIVQPDTLYVVPDSNSLAVSTTGSTGVITNLNISGTPTALIAAPIAVETIVINKGSTLALNASEDDKKNWATGVKSLTTSNAISTLNVNSAALKDLLKIDDGALNVNSSNLAVTTIKDNDNGAAGSITNLNITGTPKLTAAAPITVGKIEVNSNSSLALNNWATGVTALTTSSPIKNVYVNSAAELSDLPKAEGSALNVNSQTLAVTTSPDKGVIENLNISGNPQLSGSGITVNNITVNSSCSENECWKLAAPLNGVNSVNAKNPTPAPAITEPVIKAITVTGSGAVAPSPDGSLNINSPSGSKNPIKITATEPGLIATVNVSKGAYVDSITNAKTINIRGSDWEFEELVTNPETIDVAKGLTVNAINSVFSGTTVATPKETLNVAFDHLADVNGYLNIGGDGTISDIDFSTVVNRPSLMYTPSTSITQDNIGNIEGNLAKADTLVLTGNVTTTGLPKGFTGIEYPSPPAKIDRNLKRLGLGGIVNDTIITTELVADLVVSPSKNGKNGNNSKPTISIPFTASGMPSAFYLKTVEKGSYSIDFSSADRPTTTFEIAGGTVTSLKNVAALNDQLIITAGNLPNVDIDSMSTLSINGSGWMAPGTFSNLNSLDITSSGVVAALNVAGLPLSKPSGATLNVLTTSAQQLPVTIDGTLTELHASDGANLGAIDVGGTLGTIIAKKGTSLGAIDVGGVLSELNAEPGSSFGAINVASGGELPTLIATGATLGDITIADGGTLSTLTATGATLGAIKVVEGGTLEKLKANKGTTLGDIVGAQKVTIADGASLGAITNATEVNISGVATTLGPITNAGTVNAGSLPFEQVQVGSGLPAGAKTGSTSGQNLVLNTPKKAVNLTTKRIGTLTLGSGAKLGATSGGVNNLAITGNDWSAGTIPMTPDDKDTATVNIGPGVNVAGITVPNSSVGTRATEEPQPLNLTITPIPTGATEQTLAVTTSGNISGDLNFSGLPKGTTVNLEEAGGSLKGNIKGVNNVVFSGDSKFNGTIEADSVKVTGKLNAMQSASAEASLTVSRSAPASRAAFGEPPQPALDIASGGTLVINNPISFKAGYQQNGEIDLEPVLDASARQSVVLPSVNVSSITIGPDAKVVFDSSKVSAEQIVFDPSKDSAGQYVLMKAESDINQPVKVAATNEQYDHYYAMLTSSDKKSSNKQLMVLATQPMQAFVCDMAAAGGAPASAVRAVDVAVAPKNPTEAAAARSRTRTTGDPLNTFVVQRASTPASAAQLAKQLTPNNTGSNITASRDAQQMSSKAIDTRNTNRRTGMNSGDMMESGGVWIQYAYNNAKQDEKDGVYGYKDKTNGFTLGADWELDPMFDAGVAYTYAKSDISGEGVGSGSTMDSKNHIFTLYGSYDQDDMFMDGMISYASGDNKGHRNVSGNRVQSSYDSKSWGIGLSGGMTLPTSEEWSWQPLVAFNYYRITTDDYRESAPLSHLAFDQVKNDNYTIMELGAGVRLMGDIQMDDLAFRPAFKLMVLHDFKDDPVTMTAHYAAGGESFVVHGAKRDTTRYQFAASVDMDLHDNMTLSFNYSHDWMDNFKSDGFIARLRYDF